MDRVVMAALLCGSVLMPAEAGAFWRRSQVSMCADATSEAERMRHRCWELDGYLDPGWPALGLGRAYAFPGRDGRAAPLPVPQRIGKGVTRRLG